MKVKFGKYTNWVGPYQLAELLKYVGVSDEDKRHDIGTRLSESWVGKACSWIHARKSRKMKVKIDYYDTWSMDHTLSVIIAPMLVQLKSTKHGAPSTEDSDVPDELKSTNAPPVENEWDTDENYFKRWDYVLDEMIWAFTEYSTDCPNEPPHFYRDKTIKPPEDANEGDLLLGLHEMQSTGNDDAHAAYHARMTKGFALFGKYYRGLWD